MQEKSDTPSVKGKNYADFSRDELIAEINRLKKTKKYGLVWEHKKEEVIENFKAGQQPYLKEVEDKRIENAPGEPTNLIIEGDNFDALSVLNYTHAGMIDVIYIDPPYNTGNKDFIYNDNYVDSEDAFRHSKWLSFMEPRLELAKSLLKDDGVILISIDEHEQASLKMLCDEVFGEENYIDNFIWIKNSTKNLSKTTSTNHEYVLCYANSITSVSQNNEVFRVQKEGLSEVKKLLKEASEAGRTIEETERLLKTFYRENQNLKGISSYSKVGRRSDGSLMAYTLDNTAAPKASGKAATYDVIHPIDGGVCKCPVTGWRYTEKTMMEHINNGLIEFYDDHTHVPRFKRYLDTVETEVQRSVISDFTDGKKELARMFGDSPFENPKPTTLLKTLLRGFRNDIVVVDFFAGSGTTGQSVSELNEEDGGHRQFILCTNNGDKGPDSTKIAEDITYPRIKTAITGKRQDGSKYSDGISANLRYYKIKHEQKLGSNDANRLNMSKHIEDILQIKENAFEEVKSSKTYKLYKNSEKYLCLALDAFEMEKIIEKITEENQEKLDTVIYSFSYSRDALEDDFGTDFDIKFKAMPEGLLKTYLNITENLRSED